MGRHKGCTAGPGRPKATPESRKQYGKTSMSFSITELKVLNRLMRTPWWRTQMRNAGCCKCAKKEHKCQQVHHLFRFLASGSLELLLVDVKNELLDISGQLQTSHAFAQAEKMSERLKEVAEKLPPDVLGPDPSDTIDFAMQKAQKAEEREFMRVESLDDDALDMLEMHLLQQQQRHIQAEQQSTAAQMQVHMQAQAQVHAQVHAQAQAQAHAQAHAQAQQVQQPPSLLQQLGATIAFGGVGLPTLAPTASTQEQLPPNPGQHQQHQQHQHEHSISHMLLQMADVPTPALAPPPHMAPSPDHPMPGGVVGSSLADMATTSAMLAVMASDSTLQQQILHHHAGGALAATAALPSSGLGAGKLAAPSVVMQQVPAECMLPALLQHEGFVGGSCVAGGLTTLQVTPGPDQAGNAAAAPAAAAMAEVRPRHLGGMLSFPSLVPALAGGFK